LEALLSGIYSELFMFPVEESEGDTARMSLHLLEMAMSVQSNNQVPMSRKDKRTQKRIGDGEVHDAQHDADVIHLISAEVDKRAAAVHGKIAEAAYFRAEKRGFESGHELEDWLATEQDVEQQMQQP
jgi:hypothetical protein